MVVMSSELVSPCTRENVLYRRRVNSLSADKVEVHGEKRDHSRLDARTHSQSHLPHRLAGRFYVGRLNRNKKKLSV